MSYSNYEQTVVLNGYALSGIQSVDGSYGIAEKPVRVAGVGFIDALIDSPLQGNFSINRKMVSTDPLLEADSIGNYKFDEDEISGAILYDNNTKGFGFTQARINRYSVSCSVGQLPEIQTDLTIYGKLGKTVTPGLMYEVDQNHENYPFNSYVFFRDKNFTTESLFGLIDTDLPPSVAASNTFKDILGLTKVQGETKKYTSDWFLFTRQGINGESYTVDTLESTTSDISDYSQSATVIGPNIGKLFLQHDGSSTKYVDVLFDKIYIRFNDATASQGIAFNVTPSWLDASAVGPNGMMIIFPDEQGVYNFIYYNINDEKWYGLINQDNGSAQVDVLSSFAGGRSILIDKNIASSWSDASLKIEQEQYNSLSSTSTTISNGNALAIGQDAFEHPGVDYSSIITKTHPPIKFTDQASMSVNVSDFSIDAISDFSFSRTLNLNPVYALPRGTDADWQEGSAPSTPNLQPVQVDTQYPIETDINFTMIVDEYEIREIKDRLQAAPKSTVSIEIRDGQTKELINGLTGHNVRLIGESINLSTEGEMSISLTYKGYDTLHNPVS